MCSGYTLDIELKIPVGIAYMENSGIYKCQWRVVRLTQVAASTEQSIDMHHNASEDPEALKNVEYTHDRHFKRSLHIISRIGGTLPRYRHRLAINAAARSHLR